MLAVRSLGTGRMAGGLTRYAYAALNNPRFRNTAARVIQRVYRGARARYQVSRLRRRQAGRGARTQPARARIGNPIQRNPARRRNTLFLIPGGTPFSTKTLYTYEITGIPQGPEITNRTRDIINLKGFKICANFLNQRTNDNVFLNYAILNPKNDLVVTGDAFFRSYGLDRGLPFDSNELTSMDYHCRPINTDQFNIISHKRIKIAAKSSDLQNVAPSAIRVMRFVKCKRQLRWTRFTPEEGEPFEFCSTPIYFVWWCSIEGKPNEAASDEALLVDCRIHTYFSNPTP